MADLYKNAIHSPSRDTPIAETKNNAYLLAVAVLHPRLKFSSQDFGVSVDGGHEAEAHGSADGLCDLALVDGSQTGLVSVLNTAQG